MKCSLFIRFLSWWRHQMETFSALLAICAGIHRSPMNSPHTGQWRGTLMFSLICARINCWVNNREAGDLRRHRAHYDVIVMIHPFGKRSYYTTSGTYNTSSWLHVYRCPTVCPRFPGFFFATYFEISIWYLVCTFIRWHDKSSLGFIGIGSLWPTLYQRTSAS